MQTGEQSPVSQNRELSTVKPIHENNKHPIAA